jgi:hypothetical protein
MNIRREALSKYRGLDTKYVTTTVKATVGFIMELKDREIADFGIR